MEIFLSSAHQRGGHLFKISKKGNNPHPGTRSTSPHHAVSHLTSPCLTSRLTMCPIPLLVSSRLPSSSVAPLLILPPHRTHPSHPNTSQISPCYMSHHVSYRHTSRFTSRLASHHMLFHVTCCFTSRLVSPHVSHHVTSHITSCLVLHLTSCLATRLTFAARPASCLTSPHVLLHVSLFHHVTPHCLVLPHLAAGRLFNLAITASRVMARSLTW